MTDRSPDEVLEAFTKQFGARYALVGRLGEGCAGTAYQFTDTRRRVDVCVKLYHAALPPLGTQRDWTITSSIKHSLVADTFTVESFTSGGTDFHALVTRFIAGDNLGRTLDRVGDEPKIAARARDLLFAEVGRDVCDAVAALHAYGVGHGDLHERNVIVCRPNDVAERLAGRAGRHFVGILIDFDNATHKSSGTPVREDEHIAHDVRAIRRLLDDLLHGSPCFDETSALLHACPSARAVRDALDLVLEWLKTVHQSIDRRVVERGLPQIVRATVALSLTQGPAWNDIQAFVDAIAKRFHVEDALRRERDAWSERVAAESSYPSVSASVHVVDRALVDQLLPRT